MERAAYDNMRQVEQSHWWFCARREILSDQIRALRLPPDARILEVGCGTGGNLQMLAQFGLVTGLEPDEPSRRYAQEVSGACVLQGALPASLPKFDGPFDLVAALDVIEHLDDDAASLVAISRLLKPGGTLLTTVPAHPWMWSQHDRTHHHKRRYRRADFLGLVRNAGLSVKKISYFNSLLFAPIAFVRLVNRGGTSVPSGDATPPAVLNRALRLLFSSEKRLLRIANLPFGVSLLVLAEKPR